MNVQEQKFETVKPHVLNFLRENYWKIKNLMSWEDAVGEAQLQFVRTVKRLETRNCVIQNEKHLMSLFKTSWSRHFITLSNKATKERIVTLQTDSTDLLINSLIGEQDNSQYVQNLIETAPKEIKQVLGLMAKAPDELAEMLQNSFRANKSQCNTKLSQLLGTPNKDWIGDLFEYFNL